VAADLAAAGFEIQLVEDLSRWKAGKLVVSSSFVLDALYPAGPERDRAARLIQVETATILAAAGYSIAELETESTLDFSRFAIQSIDGYERQGSSTYQSLARTGDVETDFLNGEVVLLARQLGRRAPLNAALLARVHRAVRDGSTPGAVPLSDLAEVLAAATVRIDAATLLGELDGASAPAVLDVRWALGDPDGEKHYLDGHLPGAVYVDLDAELASTPSAAAGRHPLPEVDRLQVAARRWGLRAGAAVVVYDDNGGQSAARAWWLLRWAGVCDVRILDGGLRAWTEAGGEVVTGAFQAEPGDVVLTPGHLPVLDADAAAALPEEGTLVDARGAERYRGEVEPIDSRAGHIPGAISLPTAENLASNGRFRSVAELRDRFAAAGLRTAEPAGPVGVYCGSGVTAAHEIAALQIAGLDAALYPGSWSAWSGDPARPVATGAAPS
jgi:thiosulfate/3-mercaptopyruvate sulfurtransferase